MRSRVDAPTKAMNSGMRGSVPAMISAEIQSWVAIAASTATGTIPARQSCGRYSEK